MVVRRLSRERDVRSSNAGTDIVLVFRHDPAKRELELETAAILKRLATLAAPTGFFFFCFFFFLEEREREREREALGAAPWRESEASFLR